MRYDTILDDRWIVPAVDGLRSSSSECWSPEVTFRDLRAGHARTLSRWPSESPDIIHFMSSERQSGVVVASGDLRDTSGRQVGWGHRWTSEGVSVEGEFTGAHLLHLAIAGCVLNDVHREAEHLGIAIDGVRVEAWGEFDTPSWQSTGVEYQVVLSSAEPQAELDRLLSVVDDVAEIPKALRQGAEVRRV